MKNNNVYLVFAIVILVSIIPAIMWSMGKHRVELTGEISKLESVTTTAEEVDVTVIETTTTATESSTEKITSETTSKTAVYTTIPETATIEKETTHTKFKKLTLPTITFKHTTTTEKYEITPQEFKQIGVIYANGYKFTWYSERVLPGIGLNIPGRHSDGNFVRDGDGYICVASSDLNKGTVVDTPFGKGKVYDVCGQSGTIDIYVSW